ncbi:MAG: hypothetical protein Q7R88_00980 [bacterium]|nr:hypothetical protein [bacterium]
MPTRTTLVSLVLCLILAAGGIWLFKQPRKETYYGGLSKEQVAMAAAVLERDADKDELKDWEEQLWQTDPKNHDTDGDGTNDGEEIRLGRNPLTPSTALPGAPPNDFLDKETIETKTTVGKSEWTGTDRLSREFFSKYMALKQSGKPFTSEEAQKLISDVVNHYPPEPQKKIWSEDDSTVSSADDTAAYRQYGNAVGAVILKHQDGGGEHELVIYERALANEDENDLATLEHRVTYYENLINGIRVIPVPSGAVSIHLDILNALEQLKESVESMALAMEDPVRSLGGTGVYPHAVDALIDAFGLLGNELAEKGVRFGKDESGYMLLKK